MEIHKTWKDILLKSGLPEERIYCFTRRKEFEGYCTSHQKTLEKTLFFVDYDLGENETGVDFIKKFSLQKNSFLVTSYSNDAKLVEKCEDERITVIAKKEIGSISFKEFPNDKKIIVHLDDDNMTRMSWKNKGLKEEVEVLSFNTSRMLFDNLTYVPKETLFFLDMDLKEKLTGAEVAGVLYQAGYQNLYLSTGYAGDKELEKIPFLKGIINKKFPSDFIS